MSALQELQNFTFTSKYARWIPEEKRRETWREAVERVRGMMLQVYENKGVAEDINWAYDMMLKKKVVGSMRNFQFGGKPVLDKNCRSYNCSFSMCDRIRFFQEIFWVMLCGTGAGFSVQKQHVSKLPEFIKDRSFIKKKFLIQDNIESWADSIGVLISSYLSNKEHGFGVFAGHEIVFDYSLIRPAGSFLSSSSGKAPGPNGLRSTLEKIRSLLNRCIDNGQKKIRPIDAHDIVMHIADATLSGGVRRSSTISLFSPDDEEMMNCKTGDWFHENPQRGRANNTVVLNRNETTKEQFKSIMEKVREYGEPGFLFSDVPDGGGTNPCGEIGLFSYNGKNQSGWQMCNLSEINCSNVKDEKDFYERCRAASIIGTLQAGLTEFKYLGPVTEEIVRREALLGVSLTGIMEKPDIVLNPKIQKTGAIIVKETNKELAKKICINQAARTTCIKPSGTTSLVLSTSAGIHPHHAKRYIRHVQCNRLESPYKIFKKYNSHACVPSVWSVGDDDVIMFPIEVPDGSKTKNQVEAIDMLDIVKSTQKNWVTTGRNQNLCVHPNLNHNVSVTIIVKDDEWDDVTEYLYKNKKYFTAVSFISASGDKDYQQAPFVSVKMSHEIVSEYGNAAIWTSGLIELGLKAFDRNLWTACDHLFSVELEEKIYEIKTSAYEEVYNKGSKIEFLQRCRQFANKYFDGDIKTLTYCMKDVYNWKTYCDLQREFKHVPYEELVEDVDNTKPEAELACAGGACEI